MTRHGFQHSVSTASAVKALLQPGDGPQPWLTPTSELPVDDAVQFLHSRA